MVCDNAINEVPGVYTIARELRAKPHPFHIHRASRRDFEDCGGAP